MSKSSTGTPLRMQARALEHAADPPGVRPVRVHAIAFPLHAAELSATVEERGPFDLLDRYVGLAIADAGFTSAAQIAEFLGVTEHMVDRVLRFLGGIGHLQGADGSLRLTERGLRSARDDQRYILKEDRLRLYFDGVRCGPLRTAHYANGVRVMTRPQAFDQHDFRLLDPACDFRLDAVAELSRRPDRGDHNLPDELLDLNVLSVGGAFLPCYVIRAQTAVGLTTLVYSGIAELRDLHLEEIFNDWSVPARIFQATDSDNPREQFGAWLSERGIEATSLEFLDDRRIRLTLPASRFTDRDIPAKAKNVFSLAMLGSYVAPRGHVLQLWCKHAATRRKAVLSRGLSYASTRRRTPEDIAAFLDRASRQLELGRGASLDDLQEYARKAGYGNLGLEE